MVKKTILLSFLLLSLIILVSCSSSLTPPVGTSISTPLSTATQNSPQTLQEIDCVFQTVTPATVESEVINASGSAPANQSFSVDTSTDLRIYWTQSTQDNFDLSIVNLDPALASSVEKTITLEAFVGPSSGCVDTSLKTGNYKIVVNQANGPWKVWVEKIKYN
jgi:hypothetical protein